MIAFDISATAIDWCRKRFRESRVQCVVADLLVAPEAWDDAFDFVFEAFTIQMLTGEFRRRAIQQSPGSSLPVARCS